MTSFQWFIAIGGLTLATANIAWLSYQVRELWGRVIAHEQRLDAAATHRGSIIAGLSKVNDTSVTHSKCCVQLLSSYNDLDKRLSHLETDGK